MTEAERLSVEQLVEFNAVLCADTGENSALLDAEGLAAAVARPWSGFGEFEAFPSLFEKAAALLHGIASRQVFENGNKRTAWAAAAALLDINGIDIGHVDPSQSDMFVRAAALDHTLEMADLAEWFEVAANQRNEASVSDETIHLPEHLVAGMFASGWRVSNTGETFMLDFVVADDRPGGAEYLVVDRVRVPAYVVEAMLGALQERWNAYLRGV